MSDELAALVRVSAFGARFRAQRALAEIDAQPATWRASPIFERDAGEARAALVRIRNAAEEVLRL